MTHKSCNTARNLLTQAIAVMMIATLLLVAVPMTQAQAAPQARLLTAIALRGAATTATETHTTSLTIAKPTGVVSGDVLIANIAQVQSLTSPTGPTGWTKIDGRSLAGTTNRYAAVFYKVAGASEPSSYTFTVPTGTVGLPVTATGGILAFSDVNTTTGPFDVAPGTISVQISQTAVAATSITTVTANAVVIMLGQAAAGSPTWSGWTTTSPGALTEVLDFQGTGTTVGAAWATKAAAGATGAGAATLASAERNGGLLLALRPKTNPVLTVGNSPVTYNGSPQAVVVNHSVAGTVSNVLYDGSPTVPTNAGTYAVTANFAPTDTGAYRTLTGASVGSFVIQKALADCSSIAGYSVNYNGSAHTATGACVGVGTDGTLAGLDLSGTTHTAAGTYASDPWTFTDVSGNYNNDSGTVADGIGKAAPNCSSIAGYSATYNGSAHTATGTCVGVGSDGTLVGLDLTATTHTNAGTYATDAWTFTDVSGNYKNDFGTVSDSISKAAADCTGITGYAVTYDTASHTATGSCVGVGLDGTLVGLDLSGTTHTAAGTYASDPWTFTDVSGNYNDNSGTVADSIAKAAANCSSIAGYSVTYNGSAHTATGACVGIGTDGTLAGLDLTATTHTAAGTYATDAWTFTDVSGNYNDNSGTVSDSIAKAAADCSSIAGYSVTYNGSTHTATGACVGVGTDGTLAGLDLTATTHTAAGTYATDAWTFTDVSGNYNDNSGTVSDSIAKATPSLAVTNSPVLYNGSAQAATVSAGAVAGLASNIQYDLSSTEPTAAGTYAVTADFAPTDSLNYNSLTGAAAGNFVIRGINVLIGGGLVGTYPPTSGSSARQSYTNVDAGPVKVFSTDGTTPIIASERINLKALPSVSSYSEFMGVPGSKISDTYLFPWYNNAALGGLASELRFANVGNASTVVTVTIAGVERGTYPLAINETARVSYPDLDNGPVQVKSSDGVAIVASMRINLKMLPQFSSYTELLGLSASSTASTKYMFPWYNNASSGGLDSQLRFGNVGGSNTTVTVKIAGVVQNTYDLIPNQSVRIAYTDIDNGPVEITSSGGVPIIASERINLKTLPTFNSYTELMGLPGVTLTETRYVFPIYTDTTASGLQGQLRFGNVGSSNTTVTVKIGGTVQGTYDLIPNASNRIDFSGLDTGPVEVSSSGGVPIIASMRVNMSPNSTYSSNAEMMGLSMGTGLGLPGNQLSTAYWFPWYNNATAGGLDSQLRFGVP